ncbi:MULTISPECIES: nSTAND1 domain-containing NTPase [unclassified Microcoleus]|uniref:nSTAND1 domain-containing NTPase n=1 Tax=unclassified Microcoleus TaxID=2642155 RepID=UPI002FD32BB2
MSDFSRRLAIVIGINEYQESKGIPVLRNAVQDAERIAGILKQKPHEYEVKLFLDRDANKETLKNLLKLLFQEVTPDDCLLFYFAGHGVALEGKDGPQGFLIPQDAQKDNISSYLPMIDVHDWLSNLKCRHFLGILDCCFAGAFRWSINRDFSTVPEEIYQEHYERFIQDPAWQVITSASYDETAQDAFSLSSKGRQTSEHSPFATALIEALEEGKADLYPPANNGQLAGDGVITAHDLYSYMLQRLIQLETDGHSQRQTPGLWPLKKHDRGEYIFLNPKHPLNLPPAPPLDKSQNPYRGLESFDEKHSALFFGRKALIEKLHEIVTKQPLTVVLGVSGSGKSSLVKAGLIPSIRNSGEIETKKQNQPEKNEEGKKSAENWFILPPIRPSKSPLIPLAEVSLFIANGATKDELAKIDPLSKTLQEEPRQLPNIIAAWENSNPKVRVFLVKDYLKELVELCQKHSEVKEKEFCEQLEQEDESYRQKVLQLSETLRKDPQEYVKNVNNWIEGNPKTKLLLVIDQSEELFTLCQEERERETFLNLLTQLTAAHPKQLRLVLTLRSDFEPQFKNFLDSTLKSDRNQTELIVSPMNRPQLREVIEKPALAKAIYFKSKDSENPLVDKLIGEVENVPGALPLLSFTLSELYFKYLKRQDKAHQQNDKIDRSITEQDYEQLGGVRRSLIERANQEYNNLVRDFVGNDKKMMEITIRNVMMRMVAVSGGEVARRRILRDELDYPETANKLVNKIIDCFVKARLLVEGKDSEGKYVEPAHDELVRGWSKIKFWLEERQENTDRITRVNKAKIRLGKNLDNVILYFGLKEKDSRFKPQESERPLKVDLPLQRQLTTAANNWSKKERERDKKAVGFLWYDDPRLPQLEQIKRSDDNWFNQIEDVFVECSIKKKYQNIILVWSFGLGFIVVLLGGLFFSLRGQRQAQIDQTRTLRQAAETNLRSNLGFDALLSSLQSVKSLKQPLLQIIKPDNLLQNQVRETLHKALYQAKEFNRLQGHDGSIPSVSFSPDGKYFASGGDDGKVILWNLHGHKLREFYNEHQGRAHQGIVRSISFSPNGQQLATAGDDGKAWLWDLQGRKLVEFSGHKGEVYSVSFSPNRKLLATGGKDDTIRLWNLQGQPIKKFPGHQKGVWRVSFSPDGQLLATGGDNGIVRLWNLQGQQVAELPGHRNSIWGISFTPDGQKLATAGYDSTVNVWNLQTYQQIEELTHESPVWSVSFTPDGQQLATGDDQGTIRLWNLQSRQPRTELKGHQGAVWSMAFNQNRQGQVTPRVDLVTTGNDGTIRLWNLQHKYVAEFKEHQETVKSIGFTPDEQHLATGDEKGFVRLWNLQDRRLAAKFGGKCDVINSLSFSPTSQELATGEEKGFVCLWNLQNRQLVAKFKGYFFPITTLSFSPNGQQLAVAGKEDFTTHLRNLQGELLATFSHDQQGVNGISFSRNREQLATVGNDLTARLWSLPTSTALTKIPHSYFQPLVKFPHQSFVRSVSFSPDGQLLATGDDAGFLYLWNLRNKKLEDKFKAHPISVLQDLSFSPDGQQLATAGGDGYVRLWNLQRQQLAEFKVDSGVHSGKLLKVRFSPNGRQLVTLGKDGTTKLWSVESYDELIARGCTWVRSYLESQPQVETNNKYPCNG